MAAAPTRGYFLLLNSILYKNIVWRKVNVRGYARVFHRNPIKVLSVEEARKLTKPSLIYEEPLITEKNNDKHAGNITRQTDDLNADTREFQQGRDSKNKKLSIGTSNPHNEDVRKSKNKKSPLKFADHAADLITFVACGEKVEVRVISDKLVAERKLSALVQNVKSTKARKASGLILLEGERFIADALHAGARAEAIFFCNPLLLSTFPLKKHPSVELYQVKYDKIQLWSDLTTSPGVLGIFDVTKLHESNLLKLSQNIPLTLICDNVRDPGNMGSIIRCAAAVGCKMLITTPECVDVWDSKVLRAAAGAHFRLKLVLNVEWDEIPGNFVTQETSVILADSSKKEKRIPDTTKDSWRDDPKETIEVTEEGNIRKRDAAYLDNATLRKYRDLPLPHYSYDNLQLKNSTNSVALVIGGEAHGLSSAAHLLAHEFSGMKAYIPLENQVESLNAGVAVGILAYEIRRLITSDKVITVAT